MRGDPRPKVVEVLSVDSSAAAPTFRYQKARPGQRTTARSKNWATVYRATLAMCPVLSSPKPTPHLGSTHKAEPPEAVPIERVRARRGN
jgi:hypothetical protein